VGRFLGGAWPRIKDLGRKNQEAHFPSQAGRAIQMRNAQCGMLNNRNFRHSGFGRARGGRLLLRKHGGIFG
jgi:hypothetical protein